MSERNLSAVDLASAEMSFAGHVRQLHGHFAAPGIHARRVAA
jgi:hypothetical protein